MPATKIVDEQEVLRWFAEGRTYEWMSGEYLRKYHIKTGPSLWGNFRRRRGLPRRTVRDSDLIPWAVREEHRHAYPLRMLRIEARVRVGDAIREVDVARHRSFLAHLKNNGLVVAYLPDEHPEVGFVYVPRERGDTDIIRDPKGRRQRRATRRLLSL